MSSVRTYYRLAKPGIVYGNAIAAIAGFFFAAQGIIPWVTFLGMLVGISLVIGSACAYNNVLDRGIDTKMQRTRKRAIPAGDVSIPSALFFATTLLFAGVILLWLYTNTLTVAVALVGHFAYVVLYGIAKRTTVHSTLIGTLSGSTPPVIGYVAVTGQLDWTALLLFLVLVAWQMPHFYAIAIFRLDDYRAAGIPILSVVRGIAAVRRQIIVYIGLFLLSCIALWSIADASLMWLLVMSLTGLYWLYIALRRSNDDTTIGWSRQQFGFSLTVLLLMSVMLSLDHLFI